MRVASTYLFVLVLLSGCGVFQPKAPPPLVYRAIPEALLQECQLPPAPLSNAELSDAFARAYQCGEQGNVDKQRIRNLTK